ncbi:unnamed protein product [Victoria cruziana]
MGMGKCCFLVAVILMPVSFPYGVTSELPGFEVRKLRAVGGMFRPPSPKPNVIGSFIPPTPTASYLRLDATPTSAITCISTLVIATHGHQPQQLLESWKEMLAKPYVYCIINHI